jgi:predicted Zn-dependent protease
MFERMAQSFATNPAGGFGTFLGELRDLEGPALADVRLSRDEERRAGLKARDEYLRRAASQGYRVDHDPKKLAYLRELVDGLARHMEHRDRYPNLDITLINAPISDGQTFPGGSLVFTTALLDEPDEATIAAVVAHELAHLDRAHMYELARRSKAADTAFQPGAVGFQNGADFNRMFMKQFALFGLLMNPFRPEQEHEADCQAVTWLYLEGYDPSALARFLERMHRHHRDQPENPYFAGFGRSHPYTLDRRDHVQARLAQLQRWRPRDDLRLEPDRPRRLVSRFRVNQGPAPVEGPPRNQKNAGAAQAPEG